MIMYFHTIHIFFSLMNTFTFISSFFSNFFCFCIISTLQKIIFVMLFLFIFTNTLIKQVCIQLIKSDSKDIDNVIKYLYFTKMKCFSIHQKILKKHLYITNSMKF